MPTEIVRTPGAPIWERFPEESARAYAAFCVYRDLGPQRNLDEVTRRVYEGSTGTVGRISDWSTKWQWVARARAHDDELDRQNRLSMQDQLKEMNKRHAEEARALQRKALERLRAIDPNELNATELLRFIIEAAKLERTALGVPESIEQVEHTGKGGGPITVAQEPHSPQDVAEILAVLQLAGVLPAPAAAPPAIDVEARVVTEDEAG